MNPPLPARLLPTQDDLHLAGVEIGDDDIRVSIVSTASTAICPACHTLGRREEPPG